MATKEGKKLFNLYLDERTKESVQVKLDRLLGYSPKGMLASLIRAQLRMFCEMTDEEIENSGLLEMVNNEFIECNHGGSKL